MLSYAVQRFSNADSLETSLAHLEVCRQVLEEVERDGHALDHCMLLPLQVKHGLVEYHALVLVVEHLHEALHEVLRENNSVQHVRVRKTLSYFDFVPNVVVRFQHAEVVLYRNDVTMTIHKVFRQRAGEIRPGTHGNHSCLRRGVVLAVAELASSHHLLRPFIICEEYQVSS